MSFKFGVDGSHALQNVIPLYGAFGGIYTFSNYPTNSTATSSGTGGSPWASFMLGTVQSGNFTMRNVECLITTAGIQAPRSSRTTGR